MNAQEIVRRAGIQVPKWTVGRHYLPCPQCRRGPKDTRLTLWVKPDGHATWACNRCEWRDHTNKCGDCGETFKECRCRKTKTAPLKRAETPSSDLRVDRQSSSARSTVKPVAPVGNGDDHVVRFEDRHQEFWDGLEPITAASPVGRYLTNRGCSRPLPGADLRWHPDFGHLYERQWRGPVMIGLITDALTGAPMSFHFTWIRPDGQGKAPLDRPRLMAKGMPKQGGVIRLLDDADAGSWLMVGEGIETCLTVQGRIGARPVWACIDAGNMARLPYVPGIETLIVLTDWDRANRRTGKRAGEEAAADLAQAWEPHCPFIAAINAEQEGWDLNDLFASMERGAAA